MHFDSMLTIYRGGPYWLLGYNMAANRAKVADHTILTSYSKATDIEETKQVILIIEGSDSDGKGSALKIALD